MKTSSPGFACPYCVAIKTDNGLIFASDSVTNAGIDHVSTYSKMHTFVQPGNRIFVLLAAGNLAPRRAWSNACSTIAGWAS